MANETKKYVDRHGIVANSDFDGEKWKPAITDNDGFWASIFGAG